MSVDTSITHIRPRFAFEVQMPAHEVFDRLRRQKEADEGGVVSNIIDDHVILDVPERERHFWSPQLNFRVEPSEDAPDRAMLKGLIGPRPSVWTLFMFIYFSIGTIGFFISCFGVSRWMLGEWSNLTLALPLAAIFMATAYKAGKYGEKLGHDQIEILKDHIRAALEMQ